MRAKALSTNQMTSIGGQTPIYDADGHVLNDFLNTYSWDAYGRPTTVDSVAITYDASGRMVEQDNSGAYSQIYYSPSGFKMMYMNGSVLVKNTVPLPGGASEWWTPTANYYRHSDWLGSSRLASTVSRTVYYDGAYGPFGEPYAGSGTTDLNFTGMDQTIGNTYDFPAREYGIQGRWPSPDPAGLAAVNPMDPQTWNRYAYVRNSPLELVDPLGLCGGNANAPCPPPPPPANCTIDGGAAPCVLATGLLQSGAAGTYDGFQVTYIGGQATFIAPLGNQVTLTGIDTIPIDGIFTNIPVFTDQEMFGLIPASWTITDLAVWSTPVLGSSGGGGITNTQLQTYAWRALSRQTRSFAIYHTCGTSPEDAAISWMRDGAIHYALAGGYFGFIGGEGLEPIGGGVPGSLFGAFVGGTLGAGGGVLEGTAVGAVCQSLGAY